MSASEVARAGAEDEVKVLVKPLRNRRVDIFAPEPTK